MAGADKTSISTTKKHIYIKEKHIYIKEKPIWFSSVDKLFTVITSL